MNRPATSGLKTKQKVGLRDSKFILHYRKVAKIYKLKPNSMWENHDWPNTWPQGWDNWNNSW
jgi:hypothetical protein